MVDALVRSLTCPKCGAPLTIRAGDLTVTVVCGHCNSVLDAKDPSLKILQTFEAKKHALQRIPLGARGTWRGAVREVIGYQIRTINVEAIDYSWSEYLLFNPYEGFRYLTEYNGHWNDVILLKTLPTVYKGGGWGGDKPYADVLGERFTHFQTAKATTTYVIGEFPWQVRVGEAAEVSDYVDPPRVLSSERTKDETTWSMGEYATGDRIWQAFNLPGDPPERTGVYANQPSPYRPAVGGMWKGFAAFATALLLLAIWRLGYSPRPVVFQHDYRYVPPKVPPSDSEAAAAAFVTDTFTIGGRTSDLELSVDANLRNSWIYFDFALINDSTGTAYDFGRELSFYYGSDQDGPWTEGSNHDRALIPTVPGGRYYVRVQPQGQPVGAPLRFGGIEHADLSAVTYTLRLRRDVPWATAYVIALLLLVVPPVFLVTRNMSFEHARWQESDYADEDDE
jgi:hypothetical protein